MGPYQRMTQQQRSGVERVERVETVLQPVPPILSVTIPMNITNEKQTKLGALVLAPSPPSPPSPTSIERYQAVSETPCEDARKSAWERSCPARMQVQQLFCSPLSSDRLHATEEKEHRPHG
jgi:hypothetical protein